MMYRSCMLRLVVALHKLGTRSTLLLPCMYSHSMYFQPRSRSHFSPQISEQVEERARKAKASLARALDKPVPKKKDKPVMFRSVLPKKKVSKTHERKQDLEEIALEEFLARDFGV